jgi:transposase
VWTDYARDTRPEPDASASSPRGSLFCQPGICHGALSSRFWAVGLRHDRSRCAQLARSWIVSFKFRTANGNAQCSRILVDTLGLLLHAIIHPADIQDRDGGILLLSTLFGLHPFLKKLFADGGYQGPQFQKALADILPAIEIEIARRSDQAKGFVMLPRRWVVERTIAWLNRCRRLAKDWENLDRKALAFLRLASIRVMLRKLCNPT